MHYLLSPAFRIVRMPNLTEALQGSTLARQFAAPVLQGFKNYSQKGSQVAEISRFGPPTTLLQTAKSDILRPSSVDPAKIDSIDRMASQTSP